MHAVKRLFASGCAIFILGALVCGSSKAASGIGLVTIVSPAGGQVTMLAGATQVNVHLEVAFGKDAAGDDADPATFSASLTGMKSATLTPFFTNVTDAGGHVTGKKADVTLPLKKKYTFKAKVSSLSVGGAKPAKDSVSAAFVAVVGVPRPPVIQNFWVSNARGATPDGKLVVNVGQAANFQAVLSDPDGEAVVSYALDLGNGVVIHRSSSGFTSLNEVGTYAAPGDFTARVTATNTSALSSIQTLAVHVNAPPVARLKINPTQGTFRYPVAVDALDSSDPEGDALTCAWDFGDGSAPGSGVQASHVYPTPSTTKATYTVTLTVTDAYGASATANAPLLVTTGLTGATMLDVISPLNKEVVTVGTALPVNIILGKASSGADPDLSTFKVILNRVNVTSAFTPATDPLRGNAVVTEQASIPLGQIKLGGLTNTLTAVVVSKVFTNLSGTSRTVQTKKVVYFTATTGQPPTASFTLTPPEAQAGDTVTFDASTSRDPQGKPLTYAWDFGDSNTLPASAAAIVTHVYASAGAYATKLTVSNGTFSATATGSVLVRTPPPPPPAASFTVTPSSPVSGQSVSFDASASTDPHGLPLTYAWNFGDGHTLPASPTALVTHAYASAGTFTANLTASNGGSSASATATVVVRAPLSPPIPRFASTPGAPQTGQTVTFDASASTDPQGLPLTFAWDFGDGNTLPASPAAVVTHAYASAGAFTATLTVFDGSASATSTAGVVVRAPAAPPSPSFTVNPVSPAAGQIVGFDASASTDPQGLPLTFAWDFGDGSSLPASSSAAVTHTYAVAGTYVVRLTASNGTTGASVDNAGNPVVVRSVPTTPVLTVSNSAVDFGDLSGTLNIPEYSFSPSDNNVQWYPAWAEKCVEITNSGTGTLTVSSVATDRPEFQLTNADKVAQVRLNAGESYFVGLKFSPRASSPPVAPPSAPLGAHSGILTIVTNAGTQTVALAGNVVSFVPHPSVLLMHSDIVRYHDLRPQFEDIGDNGEFFQYTDRGATLLRAPGIASVVDMGIVASRKTWVFGGLINQGTDATITGVSVVDDAGNPSPDFSAQIMSGYPTAYVPASQITMFHGISLENGTGIPRIQVTFAPTNAGDPARLSAKLLIHSNSGADQVVGLTGIGIYDAYLTVIDPKGTSVADEPFEFKRLTPGTSTNKLGSVSDGLVPATLTFTNIGRKQALISASISPIGAGASSSAFTLDKSSLGLTPTQQGTVTATFSAQALGHYSAVLKIDFGLPFEPPLYYLLHGFCKGAGAPGALGTSGTLYTYDGIDFDNTVMLSLDNKGVLGNFSQLDGIQDPFETVGNTVDMGEYDTDWSDLVMLAGAEYTADGGVFSESLTNPDGSPNASLTPAAKARLQGGSPIHPGCIESHGGFVPGPNGNVDIQDDGADSIRVDATPDGILFYTEVSSDGAAQPTTWTALKWERASNHTGGVVTPDLSALLGHANDEALDLRAIKTGTGYRIFVVFDAQDASGNDLVCDMDLSSTFAVTAHKSLTGTLSNNRPDSDPNANQLMIIDKNGVWFTVHSTQNMNGSTTFQLYKEDLHNGGGRIAWGPPATVNILDAANGLLVDNQGAIIVATDRGLCSFSPTGAFNGYVLSGANYFADAYAGGASNGSDTFDLSDFNPWWLDK